LTVKGYGPIRPIESNATKEGRQKNRRVEAAAEFIIKK
jgi:outer membrane protein OmpA-like peptidoglycan-associated protein